MEKETRSTLYISEVLMKRFREACTKMFGDRQGKIKQGYVLAITEWSDKVLNNKSTPEPPDLLAKKLLEDSIKSEAQASVAIDNDPNLRTITAEDLVQAKAKTPAIDTAEDSVEAKAKKLAEERRKKELDQDEHKVLS